ncbi:DUF5691 domain-containing protein [Adhaeribacter pallidiroseus]|uniref:Uncharacterized protein n=1 Tax=Adhaeribacter pallidiroseus TaxID=2072847 RepID=A0A369QG74_9BACT|nr:DUF5691 domain-containing protein [Adhaeribacter pallidiroseus]RDC61899.1 hypothetical protein AHMF7616_00488 [Adhaeribacter pallidiroseus]
MDVWEEAVKVALVGTERQKLSSEYLPLPVQDLLSQLGPDDPEEYFLKTAALLLNYTQAGGNLPVWQTSVPQPAESDHKPVCSDKAVQTLATILEEGFPTLVLVWLQQCTQAQQRVREDYIPVLLDEGRKNVNLRALVKEAVGNRGKWLASFNADWQYLLQTETEIWEQGKPEERKQLLRQIRQEDPDRARELLTSSWKEENANSRAELLSIFVKNLSWADEAWLKDLQTDKSQKVKEAITLLLSQLPESTWVQELGEEVKTWITLKITKSLIAFSKEELEVKIPDTFPAILKKKGIQELSNNKNIPDQDYWLSQVLSLIPPAFWETHLQAGPEKILSLFFKNKLLQANLAALISATIRFKDARWAKIWLNVKLPEYDELRFSAYSLVPQLLNLLPEADQQDYLNQVLRKKKLDYRLHTIDFLLELNFNWDAPFSMKVMQELANTYTEQTMYQGFYRLFELHLLLHPEILPHLHAIEPADPNLSSRWHALQNKLIRALEIRLDLQTCFPN